MYSYILLGAAALVAASPAPAPQAFDINAANALDATPTGPPVGVGVPAQTSVYDESSAIAVATASVSATTAAGKVKRDNGGGACWAGWCYGSSVTGSVTVPMTTPAPVATTTQTSIPTYVVPSTCTPVSWTNTNAFTSSTACPTPFEVGTFCGFINPEDPCAPQPYGYGPLTTPDTVDAFEANPVFHQQALTAQTPFNYTNTFRDLNASVNANTYLGYKLLTSYDVAGCASYCDNTNLCTGFNIFVERDPQFNPDQCSCQNPASMANYKCSIWGSGVQKSAATNFGQFRDSFQVVIAGSNGYEVRNNTPATPPGTSNPQNCGGKLHNFPSSSLGQKSFPGPFDPNVCAAYAAQQNAVNQKSGIISRILSVFGLGGASGKCVQFQAAEIEKDGAGWGTHCRLFTQKFSGSQASLVMSGQYTCGRSFTWDI